MKEKNKSVTYTKCKDGSYDIVVEHDGHYKGNYNYSSYRSVLRDLSKKEYDYIKLN